MLAVPILIPRFSLKDFDTEGSLQIYYSEVDKTFTPLETKIAEMLSRRVSHVIARKRIMDLQKLNVTKDKIVEQIFLKLGKREGIKMREVFNLVIPELVEIMRIQGVPFSRSAKIGIMWYWRRGIRKYTMGLERPFRWRMHLISRRW